MIEQVCETNCPAALQTATASRILPKQQSNIRKSSPAIPKQTYPKI